MVQIDKVGDGVSRFPAKRFAAVWLVTLSMWPPQSAQALGKVACPESVATCSEVPAPARTSHPFAAAQAHAKLPSDPGPSWTVAQIQPAGERRETEDASKSTRAEAEVLVLQLNQSHYKNLDQISLIFRGDVVDLVTNTSMYQEEPFRLGWHRNRVNTEFTHMRQLVEKSLASIRSGEVSAETEFVPHAPVLNIAGRRYRRSIRTIAN